MRCFFLLFFSFLFACQSNEKIKISVPDTSRYVLKFAPGDTLRIKDIPLPANCVRIEVEKNSFGAFLRNLPLAKDNTVYYYNGQKKPDQSLHYAVIDIDIGKADLQQCADAVMRLRGEFLFSQKKYDKIHFNFLSDGKPRYYVNYTSNPADYRNFRRYMNYVFAYANTSSLRDELIPVSIDSMKIGDVFIQKGNPYGHAVIVVDLAQDTLTGEKYFLIAQSFMPAQSIHILKNLENQTVSPWYPLHFGQNLYTPQWTFTRYDLRRFPGN